MSDEMEAAGLASVGALSPGGNADLKGQPCRNCGELVEQRHCPRCGQLAASFHRPFYALVAESVSDSLALDGRIARTLPLLMFRPGRLSRDYSEGKRARYVPPFRLFLLSSLLFYFVLFAFVGSSGLLDNAEFQTSGGRGLSPAERTALIEYFAGDETVEDEDLQELLGSVRARENSGAGVSEGGPPVQDEPPAGIAENGEAAVQSGLGQQADEAIGRVIDNPRLFFMALQSWAPRLSLLLVPMTVLALSLIYAWRRRIYIYDHAIHALHLHSWMYLTTTLVIVLSIWAGSWLASLYMLIIPVYVLFSLRGAYGSGYLSSFLRMLLLVLFWAICLVALMTIILLVSILSV